MDVDAGRVMIALSEVPFPPPSGIDLAFSPDGPRLAAPTGDGAVTVYLLDLEELLELARARATRGSTACRQYLHVAECPAARVTFRSGLSSARRDLPGLSRTDDLAFQAFYTRPVTGSRP